MTDTIQGDRPKRSHKKKPFFDEEPWETVDKKNKTKGKKQKSTDNTNMNGNISDDSSNRKCRKCLDVFPDGEKLAKQGREIIS